MRFLQQARIVRVGIVVQMLLLVRPQSTLIAVHAQNYPNPSITAEPFNTSVTYRNNVCDRQRQLDNGEITSLAAALEGMQISVAAGIGTYLNIDDDGKLDPEYPGMVAILLDEVARRANFTWRDTFAIPGTPGDSGKTWTELLLWSVETYDIAADWWDNSLERTSLGIAYPEFWYDSSYVLIGNKRNYENSGEDSFDPWSWLAPFDYAVWGLILATFVFSGLIYSLLESLDPYSDKQSLQKKPLETTFMAAMGFAGHMEFETQTHPARLFAFSLAMWALLMGAAYTANLASFLVVKNAPRDVVESLADAVRLKEPICVYKDTASHVLLQDEFPNAIVVEKVTEKESFQGVVDGDCTVALGAITSFYHWERDINVNPDCELIWIGRKIREVESGFASISDSGIYCTSLIRDVVHLHMRHMKEDGFIQRAWDEDFFLSSTNECSGSSLRIDRRRNLGGDDDPEESQTALEAGQLNIKNMGGIFILHGSLSVLAVLLAFIHHRAGLTARRNEERRQHKLQKHIKMQEKKNEIKSLKDPQEKQKLAMDAMTQFSNDGDDLFDDLDLEGYDVMTTKASVRSPAWTNSIDTNSTHNYGLEEKFQKINARQDQQIKTMEKMNECMNERQDQQAETIEELKKGQDRQMESMDELKQQIATLTSMLAAISTEDTKLETGKKNSNARTRKVENVWALGKEPARLEDHQIGGTMQETSNSDQFGADLLPGTLWPK